MRSCSGILAVIGLLPPYVHLLWYGSPALFSPSDEVSPQGLPGLFTVAPPFALFSSPYTLALLDSFLLSGEFEPVSGLSFTVHHGTQASARPLPIRATPPVFHFSNLHSSFFFFFSFHSLSF